MRRKTRWDGSVEGRDDPNAHAELVRLSDWGRRPIPWLWEPLIPRRKVTLLVGDQEKGKSFFTLDLAARLSRGGGIPPGGGLGGPANTIILAGDDEADDSLYPRLERMGGYPDRVFWLTAFGPRNIGEGKPQISLAHSVERLNKAARAVPNCRLIVIDPITAFLEGMGMNSHSQVRRLLQRLTMLAKVHDAAVLVITHNRKEGADSVLHRAIGSLAFTVAARVVLTLVDDPAVVDRKLLLPAKMNLLPLSQCPGRAFTLKDGEVIWDPEPVTTRPQELQRLVAKGLATSDLLLDVAAKLRTLLAGGPLPSLQVHAWAAEQRIPRVLLFQAKMFAGIQARRDGEAQRWCWELLAAQTDEEERNAAPVRRLTSDGSSPAGNGNVIEAEIARIND